MSEIVTDTLIFDADRVTHERDGHVVSRGTSRHQGSTVEIVPPADAPSAAIVPVRERLICTPETRPVAAPDATYACSPRLEWSSSPSARPVWRCRDAERGTMLGLFADAPGVELILVPYSCLGTAAALRAIAPASGR
jgi:hypothetical protein